MLIGVAGAMCSGKDTVAEHLENKYGFLHVSISDIVRVEVERAGLKSSRTNQRKTANKFRQDFSGYYWVNEAIAHARNAHPGKDVVLSGLYCPAEAQYLMDSGGWLIGVRCDDVEARFERLCDRGIPYRDAMTFEQFLAADEHEMSGTQPHETNLATILDMAQSVVLNDGSMEDLLAAVDDLLRNELPRRSQVDGQVAADVPLILRPMVGLSRVDTSTEADLDSKDSLEQLERDYRALEFIRESYSLAALSDKERALAPLTRPTHSVSHVSNQFGARLLPAYMEPDESTGLAMFRSIEARTTDEELALLLTDEQFCERRRNLHRHLIEIEGEINDAAGEHQQSAQENDRRQLNFQPRRSLEQCLRDGISIRVQPQHYDALAAAADVAAERTLPLLELIKNERMLHVHGLPDAKVSLAVHDAVDHVWLFALLERVGLLQKFRHMFDAIGDPAGTDIFRREGEIVASIGFGVRYWANIETGFIPLFTIDNIADQFERYFDCEKLEPRHMPAFRIVRRLRASPTGREAQSLGYVFSNYLVELDEQRRKHGRIKYRDSETRRIVGELDPWSPDYLSFFVEAHHELLASRNKHRDNLLRLHIILEEYLGSKPAVRGEPLVINHVLLATHDFTSTSLPPDRITWMATNYGFTAMRDRVV
jgi:dephospho-CoA kinase